MYRTKLGDISIIDPKKKDKKKHTKICIKQNKNIIQTII
jgi:hypothetical protein